MTPLCGVACGRGGAPSSTPSASSRVADRVAWRAAPTTVADVPGPWKLALRSCVRADEVVDLEPPARGEASFTYSVGGTTWVVASGPVTVAFGRTTWAGEPELTLVRHGVPAGRPGGRHAAVVGCGVSTVDDACTGVEAPDDLGVALVASRRVA